MSRIKGKDTQPEILVRKYLHAQGFRYRVHVNTLPGKPDIVLPKYKTVIFINGCFWHGHKSCKYFTIPKTRTEWWLKKINNNIDNDKKANKELKSSGWKVLVIWTCNLKKTKFENAMQSLLKKLRT